MPYFEIVTIKDKPQRVSADPSDDKFLHCAASAEADAVISGDRHLLSLKSYRNIPIMTAAEFIKNK